MNTIDVISEYYLISPVMIRSKNRYQKYVIARQMICAFSNDDNTTADEIGMSRSNVVNSRKAILQTMEYDKKLRNDYSKLSKLILINEIT
jgi:chromosomal replication initiation ATPase DnaA